MRAIRTRTGARTAAVAAIFALSLMVDPSAAAKKDEGTADQQIQEASVQLKQLEVDDTRKAATAELGKAEALREKARSILGERKERETLQQTLEELEATIAFAAAKIVQSDRQAALDAKKNELADVRKQLDTTKTQVAQLEKEQAQLDKQLGGGK